MTAGAATFAANPQVVLTFKSAFASAPIADVTMFLNAVNSGLIFWGESTTQLAITYVGTPTAAQTFDFRVHLKGYV